MFSASLLTAIVSTAIALGLFVVASVAVVGGVTFTSIFVHSKRVAKKNGKVKAKKTNTKEKTKVAEKTKTVKKQQVKTVTKTEKKEEVKQVAKKPIADKKDLIGDQVVNENDLKVDSKYNWAYNIKLSSDKKPENNIVLSWKTNDQPSIIESLIDDSRLGGFGIINNELSSVKIEAKFQNEQGKAENYNKEYTTNGEMLSVRQFKGEIKNLLEKMSLQQVKTTTKQEEHVM